MARGFGQLRRRGRARAVARAALHALMLTLAAAGPTGCVFKRGVSQREEDTVVIRVSNNHPLDVTVYAVHSGMRMRLGTVSTASTVRFQLSLHTISPTGELRLLADPIGTTRSTLSEPIQVYAGQTVEWTLGADLRQSVLSIRS